jgi:hypothetical protein
MTSVANRESDLIGSRALRLPLKRNHRIIDGRKMNENKSFLLTKIDRNHVALSIGRKTNLERLRLPPNILDSLSDFDFKRCDAHQLLCNYL